MEKPGPAYPKAYAVEGGTKKYMGKGGKSESLQLAALALIDLLDGWNKVALLSLFLGLKIYR